MSPRAGARGGEGIVDFVVERLSFCGYNKPMSEPQYTPGPWGIEQTESRNWVGPMRPDGRKIADIRFWTERGGELKADRSDRYDADARLISSAPELVDACRPVLAEAKERADYLHNTWNPDAHVELTLTIAELRAIHAAVTKAGGKTEPVNAR